MDEPSDARTKTAISCERIELIDQDGRPVLVLEVGQDGPEITIIPDPEMGGEPATASLRVLTGGSYRTGRAIDERVTDLEHFLGGMANAVDAAGLTVGSRERAR